MPVKMTRDRVPEALASIRALTKDRILVGVPDENADRKPEDGEPPTLITNAGIGLVMEFGDPSKNIPARPFLIPTAVSMQDDLVKWLRSVATKAAGGDKGSIAAGFANIGQRVVSSVQKKITDGPFAPLSIKTIQARARRGRKGAKKYLKQIAVGQTPDVAVKPLIDTGQLRRAINFVIRPKGN